MTTIHIIGAGLFGCTVARLLADTGFSVIIYEKDGQIGGNCQSAIDPQTEIEYHKFGTHIFHTESDDIFNFVNRFTPFTHFEHRVVSHFNNREYPLPFNLDTFSLFFNQNFTPASLQHFLEQERENIPNPQTLEQYALSQVGIRFFTAFIKGYTEKQWGTNCMQLPVSILKRIPIYFDHNRTYFRRAKHVALPKQGMNTFFSNLTDHPKITINLNTELSSQAILQLPQVIYTGPLDALFNYQFGQLAWREVYFKIYRRPYNANLQVPVYNFPDLQVPKTRTHIPRNLYPDRTYQTDTELLIDEFSRAGKQAPAYPIRTPQELERHNNYVQLKNKFSNLLIGGRLASYSYLDMDQTIAQAMHLVKQLN